MNQIQVDTERGQLLLIIPFQYYPRKYFHLGLPDEPHYYPIAYQLKRLIEIDIACETFDYSLEKYVPSTENNFLMIWEQYVQFKKRFLQPSSMKNLVTVTNHLERMPKQVFSNPPSLKLWLVNYLSPEQARRVLMQIKACAKWGREMGYMNSNPYEIMRGLPRHKTNQIDPFSKEERDLILNGFLGSEYYSYYWSFVKFMLLTGCRPSEAIALKWDNVTKNFIIFKEAIVDGKYKDSTKTYINRRFPINQQLNDFLEQLNDRYSERVFNAKKGGVISLGNFTRRAWNTVLAEQIIRYRPPKTCRQTFITEAIRAGIDVATVASWVGNHPNVIHAHYLGVNNIEVPII